MAGTREALRERWEAQGRGVTFMSPQALKERLKHRCMEHMKKNRKRILENLRHQSTDVPSEVMDVSESVCMEELVVHGELSQDDYLDILTSLESALIEEMRVAELEYAEELLDEEEAWIADFQDMDLQSCQSSSDFVLCPLCKKQGVFVNNQEPSSAVECNCGLYLPLNGHPFSRFQDALSNAFEAHRCVCDEDPRFYISQSQEGQQPPERNHLFLDCNCCGSFMQVI